MSDEIALKSEFLPDNVWPFEFLFRTLGFYIHTFKKS